jgi:hypothetical protein
MIAAASAAVALLLGQAAPGGDAARAAAAAEKAAEAARAAAEAAARAAAAAEKAVQGGDRPAEAPAGVPGAAEAAWSGSAGAGLVAVNGNARAAILGASASAERRSETWILGGRAWGAWGQSRPAAGGPDETSALAGGGLLRADRRFGPAASAYALFAGETDHVKSVELRAGGEVGASAVFVDWRGSGDRSLSARADLGVRVQRETRFQYYPAPASLEAVLLVAPRLAAVLRYQAGKEVLLAEELEVLPNVRGEARTLVASVTRLTSRLGGPLGMGVSFQVTQDTRPAPGKRQVDSLLQATVDVVF